MDKRLFGIASFILGLVVMGILLSTTEPESIARNKRSPKRNLTFSVYKEALAAKKNSGAAATAVLFASDVLQEKGEKEVNKLKKEYYAYFDKHPRELADSLDHMEKLHYSLVSEMIKRRLRVDAITTLKPKFALTLSYYLNLNVTELRPTDLHNLKLSNREWYLLKTFSESRDFKIMLKRGTLTADYLQIDNLASIY